MRTGGFAGISREWSTSFDPEEPEWHELLASLPWDESRRQRIEPDRFIYVVTFVPRGREAPEPHWEIPEQRFTGPWQELLERVRERCDEP